MKRFFLYILSLFTLLSCSNSDDRFTISGEFKHLQQGEFYIYSPDGAIRQLDTIKITDGKFVYEMPLTEQAQLMLLYPNFSEHVIFAAGGLDIKIKGDARKLNQTVITGSKDNEDMTKFRQENLKKSFKEQKTAAESYIIKNPSTQLSLYLLDHFFIKTENPDIKKAQQLYQAIEQVQPDNMALTSLKNRINNLGRIQTDKQPLSLILPTIDGDTLDISKMKKEMTLISFWANWNNNNNFLIYKLKELRNQYGKRVNLISCSLDMDSKTLKKRIESDSIDWPIFCDYEGWNSKVIKQLNINDIPFYFLLDSAQNIIAQGRDLKEDIIPEIEKRTK